MVLVLVVDVVVVALVVMVEVRGAEAGPQRQHLLSAHAHVASAQDRRKTFATKSYSFGDLGPTLSTDSENTSAMRLGV